MPAKSHSNRKHYDPRMLVEHPHAESPGTQRIVTINLSESPLSWLHARGHLSNRQMLAGETLRGDYESAALGPHITMTWENIPRSRRKRGASMALNRTERMMQSKHRFDSALIALGPDLSDIAWRVICVGESVPIAEREMSWPVRSGKLVLKIALDRLAAFYRIPS
ncbi:DUF6456 domain-containing protein [Sphingorhabdus sp.]|jgi:hypothetical protein|uniref:DUF6456 domain-containing protein n=1 Tax=Sphingorhabdus sp. TaxID=1902408 RepID=UPI0037CC54DF